MSLVGGWIWRPHTSTQARSWRLYFIALSFLPPLTSSLPSPHICHVYMHYQIELHLHIASFDSFRFFSVFSNLILHYFPLSLTYSDAACKPSWGCLLAQYPAMAEQPLGPYEVWTGFLGDSKSRPRLSLGARFMQIPQRQPIVSLEGPSERIWVGVRWSFDFTSEGAPCIWASTAISRPRLGAFPNSMQLWVLSYAFTLLLWFHPHCYNIYLSTSGLLQIACLSLL